MFYGVCNVEEIKIHDSKYSYVGGVNVIRVF